MTSWSELICLMILGGCTVLVLLMVVSSLRLDGPDCPRGSIAASGIARCR